MAKWKKYYTYPQPQKYGLIDPLPRAPYWVPLTWVPRSP